jgi:hypothetical protein
MTDQNGRIVIASDFADLPMESLGEGITGGFSRIGIKGGRWSLHHQGQIYMFVQDDGHPLPYLDVVFIAVNPAISKMYYADAYNENAAGVAPTCSALDGKVPDPGVPIRQAETCAVCSHNQWRPNREGKECRDHRRSAVLLDSRMKTKPALEVPLEGSVFLKIPAASLNPLKLYGDMLTHRGAHFAAVVTRITFASNRQSVMKFDLKEPLTNAYAPLIRQLRNDPQTAFLIKGTTPQIREIPPPLPTAPAATVEVQAFGGGAPRQDVVQMKPRGRPKKVEAAQPVQRVVEQVPEQPAADVSDTPAWEDADNDPELNELLQRKMGDFVK